MDDMTVPAPAFLDDFGSDPPKKRREGKTDQPEWRLSHYVMSLFNRIILEPCWSTAVDHGDWMHNASAEARMSHEQRKRARGIKPAHLDWAIFQAPTYAQLELKYGNNEPSKDQEVTIKLLTQRNIPAGTAWTVMQAYEFVRDAGFRLHGNAANIAVEIEQRWRAADESARCSPAPKRRGSGKPRRAKIPPAQLKKINAIRGRTRF